MNAEKITGSALESYRKSHDLSQVALGEMLGVSGPTVNRWEKNEQDIPGPAQILLRLLIHGELPFGAGREDAADDEESKHFWALKLTLADWHKLEGLASTAGFVTVRDYLLHLIREHLEESAHGRGSSSVAMTASDLALLAEEPRRYGDGPGKGR